MVSQLYSCGQIEIRPSAQRKKEKVNSEICYFVDVNETLVNDIYSLLDDLDIIPIINVSIYNIYFQIAISPKKLIFFVTILYLMFLRKIFLK